MADLYHECGIAAVYHFPDAPVSDMVPGGDAANTSLLIPQILQDIQNRGQLATGISVFNNRHKQLLATYKDVGQVADVFKLNRPEEAQALMQTLRGTAAIGHVRYATCGTDDPSYAQPFERHHIQKSKWFTFGFNGQLANYQELRRQILAGSDFHLSRETDTEILMHLISQDISVHGGENLKGMMTRLSHKFDGAYNIVWLNAFGDLLVARDPLGIRPLCYATDGSLLVAASESVALSNLGFHESAIHDLPPGHCITVKNGRMEISSYVDGERPAHCFFEWIYFANVASKLDDSGVYNVRSRLGEALARQELVPYDKESSIVVPVPDTAKAAAGSMAFRMDIPCLEGLIRNRYVGRTFIESANRSAKAKRKYTPLADVMRGKKVFLVEDTIVRSTTMRVLIDQIRDRGHAAEVHVRVACPPIVAPCFYGIDMSKISELFAPRFMPDHVLTPERERAMAADLGADSLRYLPASALAECIQIDRSHLCQACVDGNYPTPAGRKLYQLATDNYRAGLDRLSKDRTYDNADSAVPITIR